ncbi:uncharacterized protein LOC119768076 [Culex quinquefasciatus]|uniref:uncharacterized protein LOC119768076 n=1 Tax=Culex quinquefasciatus TaxID=7176 RepID=UPI0018E3E91D|nr:uncharacterized protein LOC119768076 [Culex quinquefasciatus]
MVVRGQRYCPLHPIGLTSASSTPLVTPPALKLLHLTGSKMPTAPSAERRLRFGSISAVEAEEELLESARSSEFRNDLSFAIEAAPGSGRPSEEPWRRQTKYAFPAMERPLQKQLQPKR